LLHYAGSDSIYWGILRTLEGFCIGAATMCLESWLNTRSTNKTRGLIMSLYMVTTYLGSSLAQIMLNIPDKNGVLFYMIISAIFSVALVPISLTALPTPDITVYKRMPLSDLYKKTPVGVVACLISGFLVGSFYLLGTIYTKKMGLNIHQTSLFMFCGVVGGMTAQLPVGKISDRMDRRYVILISAIVLCVISPVMHFIIPLGNAYIGVSAFILGACMFIIYPICVSHINDLVEDNERVQASGRLMLLQGTGLIFGPVIVSFLMDHLGAASFAINFALVTLFLTFFIKKHLKVKPDIGYVQNTPTAPIPVATTAVFEELATYDTKADAYKKSKARKENNL
jgi:MFS family permease